MTVTLDAGSLRKVVHFHESIPNNTDAHGHPVDRNTTIGKRRAALMPQNGREFVQAQQQRADLTHLVEIRYDTELTPKPGMWLTLDERQLEILAAWDVDEAHVKYHIACKERVE